MSRKKTQKTRFPARNLREPNERLAYLLAAMGVKQKRAAEVAGLSEGHFSDIVRGKARLQMDHAQALGEYYGWNPIWLLHGKGEPRSRSTHEASAPYGQGQTGAVVWQQVPKCSICRSIIDAEARICPRCGAALREGETDGAD